MAGKLPVSAGAGLYILLSDGALMPLQHGQTHNAEIALAWLGMEKETG